MRRFTRRKVAWLAITAVATAIFAIAFVGGAGAVLATPGPSGFESGDGNTTLEATSGSNTDWNCFQGTTGDHGSAFATLTGSHVPTGCKVTSGATMIWADNGSSTDGATGVGTSEDQFKSGTKFDDACVVINSGNNPPKDEWTNIVEYTEAATATNSDGGHDLFFYGGAIRPKVNGDSSGNVYFSQTTDGCHTPGDILLAFNFLNGGGTPSLHALEWLASGSSLPCYNGSSSPPCWGNDKAISQTFFEGKENSSPIAAADNGINGTDMLANSFTEFGINLTQAIKASTGGSSLPCFANQTWVSRSSGSSFSSNPEDVEVVNRPTCGKITIIKHTLDGLGNRTSGNPAHGVDQAFNYTTSGLGAGFSLNDKDGTDTVSGGGVDANNTKVYSSVQPGTYTVTETLTSGHPAPNFAFNSVTCTGGAAGSTTSSTTNPAATIVLGFGGSVTCTYVNQQQLGAIKVTKVSTKNDSSGNPIKLAGAQFTYAPVSGTTVGTAVNFPNLTGTDGTTCVDGLPFGTYQVAESSAPTGYKKDSSTQNVTVNAGGTCTSGTQATPTSNFVDPPLSQIYVGWHSLAGTGVTTATIQCTGESAATAFTDSGAPDTNGKIAPTKTLGNGTTTLTPGTYSCTVVVDP